MRQRRGVLEISCAKGHEDSDIFGFFHHHHDERDENVECGHENYQTNGDQSDDAFESQGAEKSLILLHPIGGHETTSGRLFELMSNVSGAVDIINLEFED